MQDCICVMPSDVLVWRRWATTQPKILALRKLSKYLFFVCKFSSENANLGTENQECGLGRDVSVSRCTNVSSLTKSSTSRSRLRLGAICLGLGPVGLVSGLGPLRFVETFCAGARRAYCSCSQSDTNQHDICGLDIFVYSVFTLSFTYLS